MNQSRVRTLWHLVMASRPYFLAGGVLVYALGATVAWYETGRLAARPLIMGLPVVLLLQLMTNYLNEYWDRESDALVSLRTPFSGGSGILATGLLSARMVYLAGAGCGMAGILLTVVLGFSDHLSWFSLLVITLALLGGIAYSHPPLRLEARGVGEITASAVVCFLTPLLAYSLQTKGISLLFVATCLPAAIMQFTMFLTIGFPDHEADQATGKDTLVVRLGLARTVRLHTASLLMAYLTSIAGTLLGLPLLAALLPVAELPVAVVQMGLVRNVARGDKTKIPLMAFLALALFVVFCLLQIVGFVVGQM